MAYLDKRMSNGLDLMKPFSSETY